MLMRKSDQDKIDSIITEAGQSHDPQALQIRDGILWIRVRGNLANGQAVLRALLSAGINQVIDGDMSTHENKVIWKQGADHATVWIDFVDHEPLFRGGS